MYIVIKSVSTISKHGYKYIHRASLFSLALQVYLPKSHIDIHSVPADYMCWFKLENVSQLCLWYVGKAGVLEPNILYTESILPIVGVGGNNKPILYYCTAVCVCTSHVRRQNPAVSPHWAELFQCSHMVNISKNTHKHTRTHTISQWHIHAPFYPISVLDIRSASVLCVTQIWLQPLFD